MIYLPQILIQLRQNSSALLFISFALLAGCNGQVDTPHAPSKSPLTAPPAQMVDYWREVQPILDKRCVVCHGCYDAPCQLKLTGPAGLLRGASKQEVYEHERLFPAQPTRLFVDAHTKEQWRELGFYEAIKAQADKPSLLQQVLKLKQQAGDYQSKLLPDTLTLGLNRTNECPTTTEYQETIANEHPDWGMPYGLPALDDHEHTILSNWVTQGAHRAAPATLAATTKASVQDWEAFLNDDSLKVQLMARYLYEHLFLANLHFDNLGYQGFFKLVRSKTPPGERVEVIATRRPFDDPKVARVYYRLIPLGETLVLKTHMPYQLNEARLKRWQQLFLEPDYTVTKLPSFDQDTAPNPFINFAVIPVESRYRFLLDEARFTIMNFIKGPVCRGSVSLNVIRDQFFTVFIDPESSLHRQVSEPLTTHPPLLELANTESSLFNIPYYQLRYAHNERSLNNFRDQSLVQFKQNGGEIDPHLLWDGDGNNPNAALTIFRHHDSASVEYGLVGDESETIWVLDYPLLERIHYLLAAGYDVYGNIGHHLLSRLHMDFLRMDGERNFLLFMPKPERQRLRKRWYRATDSDVLDYLHYPKFEQVFDADMVYKSADPKAEFVQMLKRKYQGSLATDKATLRDPSQLPEPLYKVSRTMAELAGEPVGLIPDISLVLFEGKQPELVTIIRNNAHLNLDELFDEHERLVPAEFSVTVTRGTPSAHPNALFIVPIEQAQQFANQFKALRKPVDYQRLKDQFGIRRTDPRFWQLSDRIHQVKYPSGIDDYGVLDYNRLENR